MFPPRIRTNWISFLCPEAPTNFFHHFKDNILRLNTEWLNSFRCFYLSFDVNGATHWICFIRFKFRGRYISNYGVGRTKRHSRDACSYRLFNDFRIVNPAYCMASYLIGFPNVRGHCYLIAAVLPLVHSYPFVNRLFDLYGMVSRQRNLGLLRGNLEARETVEQPYFWTRLFYTLYIRYHGVSSSTELRLVNVNQLLQRIEACNPVIYAAYEEYRDDLELDRVLVSGVCSALRDYCNNFYNTPGGFESDAYSDILYKLAAENSVWFDDFFILVYLSYVCRRCTSQSFGTFRIPILRLPSGVSFQGALNDLNLLFSNQLIYCNQEINGVRCSGEIRRVLDNRVLNFPNVICFLAPEHNHIPVSIPESIVWSVRQIGVRYTRLASSNCFETWKSQNGFDYGALYHVGNPSIDISTGYHTYITMRTQNRFIEINNGVLFTCDHRLFGRTTAGSIHYYQRSSYDNFVPSINEDVVYVNPEW